MYMWQSPDEPGARFLSHLKKLSSLHGLNLVMMSSLHHVDSPLVGDL